jgi:hypothetical protein
MALITGEAMAHVLVHAGRALAAMPIPKPVQRVERVRPRPGVDAVLSAA